MALKQIEHGWMVKAWPQNPFQRGMDPGANAGLSSFQGEQAVSKSVTR
jgi:hypothetical protein